MYQKKKKKKRAFLVTLMMIKETSTLSIWLFQMEKVSVSEQKKRFGRRVQRIFLEKKKYYGI